MPNECLRNAITFMLPFLSNLCFLFSRNYTPLDKYLIYT